MKRHAFRFIAALIAVLALSVICLEPVGVSASGDTSRISFAIKADNSSTSAKTGDTVVLSVYVTNNTGAVINNFNGNISFNGSFFDYLEITDDQTEGRLTFNEENAKSSNIITFTYADSSKSLIANGKRDMLLFKVKFLAVNTVNSSGSGPTIKVHIDRCDNDNNVVYNDIVSQVQYSLATTAAPTTTTTIARSANARLSTLTISGGTLTPQFNPDFVAYSATVPGDVAEVRIAATAEASTAVVEGIGVKPLSFGTNSLTVTVTAEDGSKREYGLIIYREDEANEMTVEVGGFAEVGVDSDFDEGEAVIIASESDLSENGEKKSFLESNLIKILGVGLALLALFFFGFLSGFFTDKGIKKREVLKQSLSELGIDLDDYDDFEEDMLDRDDFGGDYGDDYY